MNGIECFSTFPSDPPCYFSLGKEKLLKFHGEKRRDLDYSFLVLVLFIFKEKRQLCPVNLMSDFHYPLFHGLILADLESNKYVLLHHKNANKSNPAL